MGLQGKRVIAVTPAGRRRYMEVLLGYMLSNRDIIDQWRLWVNTTAIEDIRWMQEMKRQYPDFIELEYPKEGIDRNEPGRSAYQFFRNCVDPDTVYVRFDDDIVYVHPEAVQTLVGTRLDHSEPFLVYANTMNNAICTHLHQRIGAVTLGHGRVGYNCFDPVGWGSGEFAVDLHSDILNDIRGNDLEKYMMPNWLMWEHDRFSINCICWRGGDIGEVGVNEEEWLSVTKPRELGRPTMIAGRALVGHYAFFTQRAVVDGSGLLEEYRNILSTTPPLKRAGFVIPYLTDL